MFMNGQPGASGTHSTTAVNSASRQAGHRTWSSRQDYCVTYGVRRCGRAAAGRASTANPIAQVEYPVALDHHVRVLEQMLGVDD